MDDDGIAELFEGLGPVSIRRMFGGKGIYHQGLIVAVELRGELMLKADDVSGPEFAAAGATRWTYEGRKGKPVLMPYWSIPESAFDEHEEMRRWTDMAFAAAVRLNGRR